jgi:hypothetical protein
MVLAAAVAMDSDDFFSLAQIVRVAPLRDEKSADSGG